MKIILSNAQEFNKFFDQFRRRGRTSSLSLLSTVSKIIRDVAAKGDPALFRYTQKWDGYRPSPATVEVTADEIRKEITRIKKEDLKIMALAARRIEKYHRRQIAKSWAIKNESGVEIGQQILPLKRVGIYAPGGKASYPSTVLMAAIPARLAGVEEIILVSPAKDGRINPYIAAAAKISGVKRIFKIGGAQAIAALAYGTQTIPQVDKIVGPGNAYVAAAKKIVFGQVDIDMMAGPSEVVIIGDDTALASFVAADMLAQLEHDEMAAALLITPSRKLARHVAAEITRQTRNLMRKSIIKQSLSRHSAIIITKNIDEALDIANAFAPEHLELMTKDARNLLCKVKNAGSVFLGAFTPEALGDYMAGTNHILPTGGTARFSSPLGVYDFYKRMSFLSFSQRAFRQLSRQTAHLAQMEGLDAHAHSVWVRIQS